MNFQLSPWKVMNRRLSDVLEGKGRVFHALVALIADQGDWGSRKAVDS